MNKIIPSTKLRVCTKCKQTKELAEFYRHPKGKDGLYCWCKACCVASASEYHKRNRERRRVYGRKYARIYYQKNEEKLYFQSLERRYGVSARGYKKLLRKQNNVCAICKRPAKAKTGKTKRLGVDHCHQTNTVRGLLCMSCNGMLAWYEKYRKNIRKYLNE